MGFNPFKRKIKLEVTDVEAARSAFLKELHKHPPSTQSCYKTFLRHHKRGTVFDSKFLYAIYNKKLLKIRR